MDLEVLKDIPGYKAILKSVLKSQILLLIEQLSEHTGEETIILTASLHDGTLSHLGSSTGKGFLEGRDEIKSQFLGYCLKSQHKKKTSEARSSPYQRPSSDQGISQKRPRTQTVPFRHAGMGADAFSPPEMLRAPSLTTNGQTDSSANVKQETSEQNTSKKKNSSFVTESVSFPSSLQLSHTQTSADDSCDTSEHPANDTEYPEQESENDDNTATSIKIEPITENEMELEITGIEPGKSTSDPEIWGQGQSVSSSSVGDPAAGNEGDQSGYIAENHEDVAESIDLTGDDDGYTEPISILATVPNFTPADSSCSFSIVDVTSLSSQNPIMLPSFLYNQQSTDMSVLANNSFDEGNQQINRKYEGEHSEAYLDQSPDQPQSYSGDGGADAVEDPTMYMPISIPINPFKQVQFNKEFYGRNKSRIVLKRHICPMCGKRLLKKSDLDRHLLVHTGDKPFYCPTCRKRFSQKRSADLHRKRQQH